MTWVKRSNRHRYLWLQGPTPMGLVVLFLAVPGRPAPVGAEPLPPEQWKKNGRQIFTDRCASCHGPTGKGDGPLAAQALTPPASFTPPGFIDEAIPSALFATITSGRLEKTMPPFGPANSDGLTESERWQVIAALYQLATPPEQLARGGRLAEARCRAERQRLKQRLAGYWQEGQL